jgi:DinB superfamily
MNEAEKVEALCALQSGRDALGAAIAGVDDPVAALKPVSGGGWSILDCVEHLVESERYLLTRLNAAELSDQPFEKSRREAKIAALVADRTRRIEAPKPAHPCGRFKTLGDALAALDATRAEVIRWVENCADDPRRMLTDHLLIEGPVTCSETLIMIAAHPARHAKQVVEIRESLGRAVEG